MNILIVYHLDYSVNIRKTIEESIFCFKDSKDFRYYYYNYNNNTPTILKFLKKISFDVVMFHYTFIGLRWDSFRSWNRVLRDFSGERCWPKAIKAIFPQDEYYRTKRIREFIEAANIDIIYTLATGKDIITLYRDRVKYVKVYTVLPGYVDKKTVKKVDKLTKKYKKINRKWDIGYRARNNDYALGEHANLKVKLVEEFNSRLYDYNLTTNIKNTTNAEVNTLFGWEWHKFLLQCDTTLGCMAGASILDDDGSIKRKVEQYTKFHPKADFNTVKKNVLKENENSLNYKMSSPRIFESAMTKTCQILIEDDYKIIKPSIHYISLKKDFSNLDIVIEQIKDKQFCKKIAYNAYNELILSEKYTYENYTKKVLNTLLKENSIISNRRFIGLKLFLNGYNECLKIYFKLIC